MKKMRMSVGLGEESEKGVGKRNARKKRPA
jgi:hypothetical protein